MEPDPWSGKPDRVIVTYKTTESGPVDPSGEPTSTWRDPQGANSPENSLVGIQYVGDNDVFYFPLRVTSEIAKDKIFRNTGLQDMPSGTYVDIGKHLIGWEWDAVVNNGKTPPNITILAASPVYGGILQDAGRKYLYGNSEANVTRYIAPSGAIVFASGTNQWAWGLAVFEPDLRIQQITYNLFADMGIQPAKPFSNLVIDTSLKFPASIETVDENKLSDAFISSKIENIIRSWAASPDFNILGENHLNDLNGNDFHDLNSIGTLSLSNLKTEEITDNSAVISWTTNQPASSQIWVKNVSGPVDWQKAGQTPGVLPIAVEVTNETKTTSHSITINGLQASTQYYFQVGSMDLNGKAVVAKEQSLRTRAGGPFLDQVKSVLYPTYRQVRCVYTSNKTLVRILAGSLVLVLILGCFIFLRIRKYKLHFTMKITHDEN